LSKTVESLDEFARMKSDRTGNGSPVGNTKASFDGGNYNNGSGSDVYAEMRDSFYPEMHNSKPTWSETLNYCFDSLVHDSTFQRLAILSVPISKGYAKEHGWINTSAGGSRFTSLLSMLDLNLYQNIPRKYMPLLKTDNALFRTLASGSRNILRGTGRIIQKYATPEYAAGYIGACIYDQQFGN